MPLVTRFPSGVPGPTGPAGPPGASIVTDGTHTVNPATTIDFTSGATVTDAGGGVAQVAVTGGGGGGVQVATVHVSSAEILALHTTPLTVIPAVSGSAICVVQSMLVYIAGSIPYTDPGNSIELYCPGQNPFFGALSATGFWDQAASQIGTTVANGNDTPLSVWADQPVILAADTGDPTLGDGTLVVTVSYLLAPTS